MSLSITKRSLLRALSLFAFSAVLAGCGADESIAPDSVAPTPKRALIVSSNVGKMTAPGFERDTGVWFAEVTHPYWALHDSKEVPFTIDLASPDGGAVPIDAFSIKLNLDDYLKSGGKVYDSGDPDNERFLSELADRISSTEAPGTDANGQPVTVTHHAITGTLALADVRAEDYDVVYYAGGNGASWQFPVDAETQRVAAEMYAAGKLVTAACHGTSALLNVEEGTDYLVKQRKVTGFSTAEEEALGQKDVMPLLLQDEFLKRGALYTAEPPWSDHVIVDGRLITGQNPPSARSVGKAIISYFTPKP
ncbi:MAG: type 1 glutamine amidotransferase domain-containing protein [Byssovorax sp.]